MVLLDDRCVIRRLSWLAGCLCGVDSTPAEAVAVAVAVTRAVQFALADEAWEVRFAVVNALRESLTPTSVATLERAVSDPHASVRMLAARILTDTRDR